MSSGVSCHHRPKPALSLVPVQTTDLTAIAPNAMPVSEELKPADFNARLQQLQTPKESAALFARLIAPFGFDSFASGEVDLVDPSRSTVHLLNWPDRWAGFHRTSELIDRDPFVETLTLRTAPFTWTDLRADPAFSRAGVRALKRAAAVGWTEGLIVPVRQASGRIGVVGLAGNRGPIRPGEREYLTLISICLHSHVRTLVGRHGFALPPAGLTPREIDALRLVAQGMPDGAIGHALGIASSTAHEFVENAKRKMNVRSRAELAALAVSLAIVNI
jgi:DNA-binding CsgD family transcriptional regulator